MAAAWKRWRSMLWSVRRCSSNSTISSWRWRRPMSAPRRSGSADSAGVPAAHGWDREQPAPAIRQFRLDAQNFQYRHEETVGAFESGQISLDEYLDVTVFWRERDFSRDEFKTFMFGLSSPYV